MFIDFEPHNVRTPLGVQCDAADFNLILTRLGCVFLPGILAAETSHS
jgi:hypothetical protein